MAGRTGLEPAASCVTGRRYNQLNYRPTLEFVKWEVETNVNSLSLSNEGLKNLRKPAKIAHFFPLLN
jgi:hypothetical protein